MRSYGPAFFLALLLGGSGGLFAKAVPDRATSCAVHAPQAATRSGLSASIILRVMRAESAGNARAVSRRGAMGCMQIMPATWRELSARYGLGSDPFEPRMNMIGGALYLAELKRQFGLPGAYAAYNAGPHRYARWLAGHANLPAETRAYMAGLDSGRGAAAIVRARASRWQDASLFAAAAASDPEHSTAGEEAGAVSAPNTLFPLRSN